MKKMILGLLTLVVMSLNASESLGTVKPLAGKKLVTVISSGEIEKAGMGMTLGLSAVNKGADVTIVIGANALKYALAKGDQHQFLAKKLTHREILQKAIKNGANVYICYMCAKALGLTEKDFIKGAKIVKSLQIFNKVYEKGVRVLSF